MIQPLSLIISAFAGDAQSQNPWSLSALYSPSGSQNLFIDKLGQIRSVDGYQRVNPVPYTTNVGGSVSMIRALYQFNRITGGGASIPSVPGTLTRQLLFVLDDQVNEWELWYTTDFGAFGTFISDFGAGSVGAIPDFATFGDQLFITNGVMTPQMWDGAALTATGATQLAAPTLTNTAAGVLNGVYKYRLVPVVANKVRKPGSVASASLAITDRSIKVDWAADADGTVVGYELYRTSGTGLDYYLVTYIDGRLTITYTDNLLDALLITHTAFGLVASHGDPPPVGAYFCVSHRGRMWWLATNTYPRRGWWSDPGDPDSVYQDRSYTDCTDADSLGDVMVGGTGEFNGVLVLWLRQSVWTISGTGQIINGVIDWRKKRSNAVTGAVHHRATARVPAGAIYEDQEGNKQTISGSVLAFLTPLKDIRLFDGISDTIISFPKTTTLARLNLTAAATSYCYVDPTHGMIVWVYPADASTEPSLSVAWNYWFGTWHEWTGTSFGHVISGVENATEQNVVLAGEALKATGAYLYHLWVGSLDPVGGNIICTFMSKGIYPPVAQYYGTNGPADMSHEKRLEALYLLFPKDATPTTLTVGILPPDAADGDAPTVSRTLAGSSRVRVPTRMKQGDANPGKFYFGNGWRLKVTSNSSVGPWTLQAIEQLYLPLPGQSR